MLGIGFLTASSMAMSAEDAFVSVRGPIVPPPGAAGLCRSYEWARALDGAPSGEDQVDLARELSRQVAGIRAVADPAQYGVAEVWALPMLLGGDREVFALRVLILRWLPADWLLMATVLDRDRNAHAVLALRTDAGDLVLDNLTDCPGVARDGLLFRADAGSARSEPLGLGPGGRLSCPPEGVSLK